MAKVASNKIHCDTFVSQQGGRFQYFFIILDTTFLYNSYIYFGNSTTLSTKVGWR